MRDLALAPMAGDDLPKRSSSVKVRDVPMIGSGSNGRWAALFALTALWEVFLRLDSRVLAASTKLWLFALLVAALALVGSALAHVGGAVAGAILGRDRAARLARPAFVLAAGALVGA